MWDVSAAKSLIFCWEKAYWICCGSAAAERESSRSIKACWPRRMKNLFAKMNSCNEDSFILCVLSPSELSYFVFAVYFLVTGVLWFVCSRLPPFGGSFAASPVISVVIVLYFHAQPAWNKILCNPRTFILSISVHFHSHNFVNLGNHK